MGHPAFRMSDKQRQTLIDLRKEINRGSDYIYGLLIKDPATYGFTEGHIPSIGRIQDVLRDAGLLHHIGAKTNLRKIGEQSRLRTPFGVLSISVDRDGVSITDGKETFVFFKIGGK